MKKALGVLVLCSFLLPAIASGQTAQLGIGAGFGSISGDAGEGLEAGLTFGGSLLFERPGGLQFGVAFDYSQYGVEDFEESVNQLDFQGVMRYLFPGDAARFFIGGKGGYSHQSIDVLDISGSVSGFTVGPTAGLVIPVGNMGLEIGLDGLFVSYGDAEVEGTTLPDTDETGFRFVGRVGLSIPLGS